MSGFDDNPFGDSPFQDPSIQQATRNPVSSAAQNLEDYNPFGDGPQNQKPTSVRGAANPPQYGTVGQNISPAVMSPTVETAPAFGKGNSQQSTNNSGPISTAELQRRQEELERKARELDRREAELNNAPFNARKNNWPPLPDAFPLQPCFYQDINVDIPVEFQRIVRHLYYAWMMNSGVLVVNFLVWIIRLICFGDIKFFGAFVFMFLFTPASYVCWFRPAYKAFRSDSSFNFMVFFFIFFAQFITNVAFVTVIPGACGIIDGIQVIQQGGATATIVGILALLVGVGFAACAAIDFLMLMKVHSIYRSTGASFAKAQQEFASGVMRNEHVQGAATNIASEAIRSQLNANNSNAPR